MVVGLVEKWNMGRFTRITCTGGGAKRISREIWGLGPYFLSTSELWIGVDEKTEKKSEFGESRAYGGYSEPPPICGGFEDAEN